MLNKYRVFLDYHMQALVRSLNFFGYKPLANLMTVVVIAITLSLPALFWVFVDNLSEATQNWNKNGQISLYLKVNLTEKENQALLEKIQTTSGVAHASLKSAEQGLAELKQQEGMEDIMSYLPENPLPAVIEIVPTLDVNSPAKLDLLVRQFSGLPQVAQAKMDSSWINRLHVILGFAANLAKALMGLLALAVVLIIGNTLRLALHNSREEVQILKLIGASESFILRPFLYSGILYGLAGALLSILLVNIFLFSLGVTINEIIVAYQMHYKPIGLSIRQILMLFSFAIILGWLGAFVSVKRQLSAVEPHH